MSFSNSIIGALFGVAFFGGSIPLIAWNESRAVTTQRSLEEGQRLVLPVDASGPRPDGEGKLVHLTGEAKTPGPLIDPPTNFAIPALAVSRESEMFQWDEVSAKSSNSSREDSPERTYTKRWLSQLENSTSFKRPEGHQNPPHFRIKSGDHTVPAATIGRWTIPARVLSEISPSEAWLPQESDLARLPAKLRPSAQLAGGYLYLSRNVEAPEIGDERVRFTILSPGPLSIVAQQLGQQLGEFRTSNGRTVLLAQAGVVSAEVMFTDAHQRNTVLTWILRVVGTFAMFVGLRLLIEPLTAVTDWIPFLGAAVDTGVTLGCMLLALAGSAITIAIAWFAVRPLVSVGLLVVAIGIGLLLRKRKGPARA